MKTRNIIIILIACCFLAVAATFIASNHPDGLEWVAHNIGIATDGDEPRAMGSAGAIIGVVVTFLIAYLLGKLLSKRK
jgi:hypothetical protein